MYLGWIDNGFNPTVRYEKEQIELTGRETKPDCRKDPETGEYYFDFHIFVNEVDRGTPHLRVSSLKTRA